MGKFYSPGKLLLTSEYTVLDGALALAVPTQPGQELYAEKIEDGRALVQWRAKYQHKPWLEADIDYGKWSVLHTNLPDAAGFIVKVLQAIQRLSKDVLQGSASYMITTNLQFPPDFGLGSSATLMNNLAEWASVDAFILNETCLGGSGYDIAVAQEKSSLLYQIETGKRMVKKVAFQPDFREDLIFVHLNKKQNSREGISLYKSKQKSPSFIKQFTALTEAVMKAQNIGAFSEQMEEHETQLSAFLELPTAKKNYFADCPVFIKSLGAWGGDFVMSRQFEGYQNYFADKGFKTVLKWHELILEPNLGGD